MSGAERPAGDIVIESTPLYSCDSSYGGNEQSGTVYRRRTRGHRRVVVFGITVAEQDMNVGASHYLYQLLTAAAAGLAN